MAGGFLGGTAGGAALLRMGPPPFLRLVGQVLPRRRRRHPKAFQQLEAFLVQRLPGVHRLRH